MIAKIIEFCSRADLLARTRDRLHYEICETTDREFLHPDGSTSQRPYPPGRGYGWEFAGERGERHTLWRRRK